MKSQKKYRYDEQNGVFIFEDEISINWLLSQILEVKDLKITKISNNDLFKFIEILKNSDLRMPNGQFCLFWLKEKLKEKLGFSEAKSGENWAKVTERYKFIIEQIDFALIDIKDLDEKKELKKEKGCFINKDKNNIKAYFEPLS